jgi:hypothetical protein
MSQNPAHLTCASLALPFPSRSSALGTASHMSLSCCPVQGPCGLTSAGEGASPEDEEEGAASPAVQRVARGRSWGVSCMDGRTMHAHWTKWRMREERTARIFPCSNLPRVSSPPITR